jgi:hypothetical protein
VQVLQVWAQVLLAVPNSRLVLKNKPFACEVGAGCSCVCVGLSEMVAETAVVTCVGVVKRNDK